MGHPKFVWATRPSVDPIGADPSNPQTWNRYAYVTNDPVNLVDPLGLKFIKQCVQVNEDQTICEWVWEDDGGADKDCPISGCDDGDTPHSGHGHPDPKDPKDPKKDPACNSISVPDRPAGADLAGNIKKAENSRWLIFAAPRLYWFYQQVRNKGPWDYKQTTTMNDLGGLTQSPYQDFGNFNFGMTGAAAGIQLQVLERAAGWGQQQAGTSSPEWGTPLGSAPYGDDPADQSQILAGFNYYKYRCNK